MVAFLAMDMDGTLLDCESLEVLAKELGKEKEMKRITDFAMNGQLDFEEAVKLRLSMLKGLEISRVAKLAEELPLMQGAEETIAKMKEQGVYTVIITGGFDVIGRIIAERLSIDECIANKMETENGIITGKFTLSVNGNKDLLLREIAKRKKANFVVAVGDGANDIPMLKEADIGIGFRAKKIVREQITYHAETMNEVESILKEISVI